MQSSTLCFAAVIIGIVAMTEAAKANGHDFNLPSFLDKADSASQQKYITIVTDPETSPTQKADRIDDLVKGQSETIQQAYALFQAQQNAIKDQFGVSVADEMKLTADDATVSV
uniref:DUF148 domain-containing protein n=1 Tax=Panagrellus redivivus TaxID=6233 RepID=A0A7E4ZWL6_PANRE